MMSPLDISRRVHAKLIVDLESVCNDTLEKQTQQALFDAAGFSHAGMAASIALDVRMLEVERDLLAQEAAHLACLMAPAQGSWLDDEALGTTASPKPASAPASAAATAAAAARAAGTKRSSKHSKEDPGSPTNHQHAPPCNKQRQQQGQPGSVSAAGKEGAVGVLRAAGLAEADLEVVAGMLPPDGLWQMAHLVQAGTTLDDAFTLAAEACGFADPQAALVEHAQAQSTRTASGRATQHEPAKRPLNQPQLPDAGPEYGMVEGDGGYVTSAQLEAAIKDVEAATQELTDLRKEVARAARVMEGQASQVADLSRPRQKKELRRLNKLVVARERLQEVRSAHHNAWVRADSAEQRLAELKQHLDKLTAQVHADAAAAVATAPAPASVHGQGQGPSHPRPHTSPQRQQQRRPQHLRSVAAVVPTPTPAGEQPPPKAGAQGHGAAHRVPAPRPVPADDMAAALQAAQRKVDALAAGGASSGDRTQGSGSKQAGGVAWPPVGQQVASLRSIVQAASEEYQRCKGWMDEAACTLRGELLSAEVELREAVYLVQSLKQRVAVAGRKANKVKGRGGTQQGEVLAEKEALLSHMATCTMTKTQLKGRVRRLAAAWADMLHRQGQAQAHGDSGGSKPEGAGGAPEGGGGGGGGGGGEGSSVGQMVGGSEDGRCEGQGTGHSVQGSAVDAAVHQPAGCAGEGAAAADQAGADALQAAMEAEVVTGQVAGKSQNQQPQQQLQQQPQQPPQQQRQQGGGSQGPRLAQGNQQEQQQVTGEAAQALHPVPASGEQAQDQEGVVGGGHKRGHQAPATKQGQAGQGGPKRLKTQGRGEAGAQHTTAPAPSATASAPDAAASAAAGHSVASAAGAAALGVAASGGAGAGAGADVALAPAQPLTQQPAALGQEVRVEQGGIACSRARTPPPQQLTRQPSQPQAGPGMAGATRQGSGPPHAPLPPQAPTPSIRRGASQSLGHPPTTSTSPQNLLSLPTPKQVLTELVAVQTATQGWMVEVAASRDMVGSLEQQAMQLRSLIMSMPPMMQQERMRLGMELDEVCMTLQRMQGVHGAACAALQGAQQQVAVLQRMLEQAMMQQQQQQQLQGQQGPMLGQGALMHPHRAGQPSMGRQASRSLGGDGGGGVGGGGGAPLHAPHHLQPSAPAAAAPPPAILPFPVVDLTHTLPITEAEAVNEGTVAALAECAPAWALVTSMQLTDEGTEAEEVVVTKEEMVQLWRQGQLGVQTLVVGLAPWGVPVQQPVVDPTAYRTLTHLCTLVHCGLEYDPIPCHAALPPQPGWCPLPVLLKRNAGKPRPPPRLPRLQPTKQEVVDVLASVPWWSLVESFDGSAWRLLSSGSISGAGAAAMVEAGEMEGCMGVPVLGTTQPLPRGMWVPTALFMPLVAVVQMVVGSGARYRALSIAELKTINSDNRLLLTELNT